MPRALPALGWIASTMKTQGPCSAFTCCDSCVISCFYSIVSGRLLSYCNVVVHGILIASVFRLLSHLDMRYFFAYNGQARLEPSTSLVWQDGSSSSNHKRLCELQRCCCKARNSRSLKMAGGHGTQYYHVNIEEEVGWAWLWALSLCCFLMRRMDFDTPSLDLLHCTSL